MTTLKSAWRKSSKSARVTVLAGATVLVFGSAMAAGVAMAAKEAPHVMNHFGAHGPMGGQMGFMHGMFGPDDEMGQRMEDRMFERLDTDKNGEISRDEIAAARKKHEERLAEMDTDKDGQVSREERRAYFAKAIEARRTEAFAKADTNGDGGVGLDEFKAQAAERAAEHFARLDRNGDGKLALEEFNPMKRMHDQRSR